jgi:hypothetical protein
MLKHYFITQADQTGRTCSEHNATLHHYPAITAIEGTQVVPRSHSVKIVYRNLHGKIKSLNNLHILLSSSTQDTFLPGIQCKTVSCVDADINCFYLFCLISI